MTDYSTTVIKKQAPAPPALSSILTIKSPTQPAASPNPAAPGATASELPPTPALEHDEFLAPRGARSEMTIGTFHTARSMVPSIAAATDGGSSFLAGGGGAQLHRCAASFVP